MKIRIVIPTIDGREDYLKHCIKSYKRTAPMAELVIIKNKPTCGSAWHEGAEKEGAFDYLHLTNDDLIAHPGWLEAAIKVADQGNVPNPLLLNRDGSIYIQAPGATLPFCTYEQWQQVRPMYLGHFFTDNYFSDRVKDNGADWIYTLGYKFTHYLAKVGRGAGMPESERLNLDLIEYNKWKSTGSFNPSEGRADYFELAQESKGSDNHEKTIEYYTKRVEQADRSQEVYYSYLMLGRLYYNKQEIQKAIENWEKAYDIDNERIESIYFIIKHFRESGNYQEAYNYYTKINQNLAALDLGSKLFIISNIYKFKLDYEFSIVAYYTNRFTEGILSYKKLFKAKDLITEGLKMNILNNFVFYLEYVDENDTELFEDILSFARQLRDDNPVLVDEEIDCINKIIAKFDSNYNIENIEDYFCLKDANSIVQYLQSSDETALQLLKNFTQDYLNKHLDARKNRT